MHEEKTSKTPAFLKKEKKKELIKLKVGINGIRQKTGKSKNIQD